MNLSSLSGSKLEPQTTTIELLPCYLVNNLTSSHEQCKFVLDNNCLEKEATFDYVHLVYCELGYEFRHLSIALLAFLVIVLFLALSSIADEFLCPSLLSVAKNLRMSDNLAGVTLLAFGNGCSDIFASIAAASSDRSELIVGELLGAGIFCTSIVSGLIFIHSDFKLPTRPILRDTSFYLLAVYLVWCYCDAREVTFYGALAFILIYVIYLMVALSGQAIHSRFMGNYPIAETQAQEQFVEKNNNHDNQNWYKWREESMRKRRKQCKDGREVAAGSGGPKMLIERQNGVTTIHLGLEALTRSTGSFPPGGNELDDMLCSTISRNSNSIGNMGYVNAAFIPVVDLREERKSVESKKQQRPTNVETMKEKEAETLREVKKFDSRDLNGLDDFLSHLSPIDWSLWQSRSLFSKLVNIIRAPLLFAAIMTIPVVDYEKRRNNWCRLLNSIHCITIPLSLALVLGASFNLFTLFNVIPIPLLVIPPALFLCVLLLRTTTLQEAPSYHPLFAYFGFLMSVLWIYKLASEIIGLLKTVGIIFSMTDTAIGLGILAWGNSLGDIVANISLAEAGYPRMALGASIGAPLLNLLLGFGFSFVLSMKPGEVAEIEYSPTITLLCSTLAMVIIAIMLSTLIPPEKSRKPFGYLLIAGYGVYFTLAVFFEYNVIKF